MYVFRRTRNAWRLVATLHAPELQFRDFFGSVLDMSHDGRTLMVTSVLRHESVGPPVMHTHIFVRPADAWQHAVTLAPFYPGDRCQTTRLSADGRTLVSSCTTIGISGGRIITMKRAGNAWVHATDLPNPFYNLREPIGLNADASVMALSDPRRPSVVGIYRWNGANWARASQSRRARVALIPSSLATGAMTWRSMALASCSPLANPLLGKQTLESHRS